MRPAQELGEELVFMVCVALPSAARQMEGKVARVKPNLIAIQLGRCSLITPDLHNRPDNCLSKRKYQPCIPGGTVRITAKAPTKIHRAAMATAKEGKKKKKNPAG